MAGLVPAIHVLLPSYKDVDARHNRRAGHDVERRVANHTRCIVMSTGGPLAMVWYTTQ